MVRYQDIARSISVSLEAGGAEPRTVPSEHELCALYNASRTTIRAALKTLQDQGLILRRQGQGTFYRPRRIDKSLGSIVDFQTEAQRAGRVASVQVVELESRAANARDVALFGAAKAAEGVVELVLLQRLDDEPAVLQRSWLPQSVMGAVTAADLESKPLYRYLQEERGVRVSTLEETLDPRSLSRDDAALLEVKPGTAVFLSHRVARDTAGAIIEVSDNLIRGDIYRFAITRQVAEVGV